MNFIRKKTKVGLLAVSPARPLPSIHPFILFLLLGSDMSAMFVTAAVAWMVFGLQINIAYILALLICTFSLLVYYGIVCVSWDTKAVDDSGESEEADDEEDGRGITLVPLLGGEGGGEDDGDGDGDGDEGEDDDIYDLPEASLDDSELGLDEEGQGF